MILIIVLSILPLGEKHHDASFSCYYIGSFIWLFPDGGPYHIKTSPMIFRAIKIFQKTNILT